MSSDADRLLARRLAERVAAARGHFAQVFDQIARQRSDGDYIDFKLAALGAANDEDAFASAFAEALRRGWGVELVTRAVEARVIAPDALGLIASRLVAGDAARAVFRPEGFNADMMQWLEAATFTAGLLRGLRRVCEVRAGRARGTGFLVGPQTVLTNWHVVRELMNPTDGTARTDSARQLSCRFDVLDGRSGTEFPAFEHWLVEWSPMALADLDVASDPPYASMAALRPHAVDFAVLRLHGAPGRMRGWYALADAGAVPSRAHEPLFVLQHPSQFAQRIGVTDRVSGDASGVVRHQAPTADGSSGGLCLDGEGRLVALHRGRVSDAGGAFLHNLAIAASAIAPLAPRSDSVEPACDTIWRLARGPHPVIGRDRTNQLLHAMLQPKPQKPILIVRGPEMCGKSFTTQIIEERLGFLAPWLASFAAAELPADARAFAVQILERAGINEATRQTLPTAGDGASTDIAWIRDYLFPAFSVLVADAARVRAESSGRLLWLVIDQLDKSKLLSTGSRQFLDTLYQQIATVPELRIVLLGLDGGLPAGDPLVAADEDLPSPARLTAAELERYLACLLTDSGIFPERGELHRLAGLVLHSVSGDGSANRDLLVRLSAYLMGPLRRAESEWKTGWAP